MAIFNSYVGLPEGIFPLEGFNLFQENVEQIGQKLVLERNSASFQ